MTPLELFALICIFAVVRLAISLRPASVAATGTVNTETGDAIPAAPAAPSNLAVLREYLDAFIVAGLVALFLITFVVRTFFIPSGSMEPTLQIHDVLLVNEFEYRLTKPHDGDIVVFPPPIPTTNDFIKRLIAGPGEKLRVVNGIVYRDDKPLNEPYIAEKPNYELFIADYKIVVDGVALDPEVANIPPRSMWTAPDRIPPNCHFMMGDNRNNSENSNIWGFAQAGGTFATGHEKGKPAHFTGHAFLL